MKARFTGPQANRAKPQVIPSRKVRLMTLRRFRRTWITTEERVSIYFNFSFSPLLVLIAHCFNACIKLCCKLCVLTCFKRHLCSFLLYFRCDSKVLKFSSFLFFLLSLPSVNFGSVTLETFFLVMKENYALVSGDYKRIKRGVEKGSSLSSSSCMQLDQVLLSSRTANLFSLGNESNVSCFLSTAKEHPG